MPPFGTSVGLMLALAGTVCLAAQPDRPTGTPGASFPPPASPVEKPSLEDLSRHLGAVTASPSGHVRPAHYESVSPPPSEGPPESEGPERSPLQVNPPPQGDGAESIALPARSGKSRIPLLGRGRSTRSGNGSGVARAGGLPSLITVGSSLALVLGLFLVVAWAMRRTVPGGAVVLPGEVVEVLGRAALAGRAQVHLVRCGSKLLLVSLSPTGVETLTEITEPEEVHRLAGLCRQAQPGSATAAFRQVLRQLAGQQTEPGLPASGSDDVHLARGGLPRGSRGTLEGYDV